MRCNLYIMNDFSFVLFASKLLDTRVFKKIQLHWYYSSLTQFVQDNFSILKIKFTVRNNKITMYGFPSSKLFPVFICFNNTLYGRINTIKYRNALH